MERVAETAKQHEPNPAIAGHGRAASPPVMTSFTPVVLGNVIGKPLRLRAAR